MQTVAFAIASFVSFFPPFWRFIIIGAFSVLALWAVVKLVAVVISAIPFL